MRHAVRSFQRDAVAIMTRVDIVAFSTRDWRFIEDEKRRFSEGDSHGHQGEVRKGGFQAS